MATRPSLSARAAGLLLLMLLAGVLADQASKIWASSGAVEPRFLVPGYVIAYAVPNAGMISGLGRSHSLTGTVFGVLGLASIGALARFAWRERGHWQGAERLAFVLLLAGMIGNTVDRLVLGYARDFLVIWVAPSLAFNLADVLVAVGAAGLMAVRLYRGHALGGNLARSRTAPRGQTLSSVPS